MKIERISSQNGSPRCPVCKAHIAPEDIECPICGAGLTPNKPSGRALPAARDPKTTQPQPPAKVQPRKPQTGGFRPFQPSSLSEAKPPAKLPAPDAALPAPAIPATEPKPSSTLPSTDAEPSASSKTVSASPSQSPSQSVAAASPASASADASPTRPVRRLKSVDDQSVSPTNASNPVRRAVPARGLNARPTVDEAVPMRGAGAGASSGPATGSSRPLPIGKQAAAAVPPTTRATPRLKPPPGGAIKETKPAISLSPRVIGIIVGVLALVGVGFGLVRLGTSMLSRPAAPTAANPSFQAKVIFAQGSPTPDAASAALAVTETVVANAAQVTPTTSGAEAAPAVVVPETPTPEATATSEATATPPATEPATATAEPTEPPEATPTAIATATALPSATAKALPSATAAVAAESSAFINYTVKSGDTCDAVAKANGISTASLAAANVLDAANCDLKAGATIRIPRALAATPTVASAASDTSAKPNFEIQTQYTVQQGDTCGGIAYRFKITAAQLVAANNMSRSSCFLRVGQKLWIPKTDAVIASPTATAMPTNASGTRNYTVQQGDVCGSIAKRFGITVALLAAANNLDPSSCPLRVGRTLVIPNP